MSLLDVKIGPDAPETFNAIIEIPRGSTNKYEVDQETGTIKLDRVLYSPLFYPFDYGYIPQTHYLDGDPLDVLVLTSHPLFPGCVVEASPIGVLKMSDEKGPDEKILCVATEGPALRLPQDPRRAEQPHAQGAAALLRGVQAPWRRSRWRSRAGTGRRIGPRG